MRIILGMLLCAMPALAQLRIATQNVPVATQYQSYSTTLTAAGGTPPYRWSVVSTTGVSLPEGMSLNPSTGVVSASQVNGQGGYEVTVQVTDSGSPTPGTATALMDFGVNSDSGFGGCQMFPADSIYNQRADQLPVDTDPSHQIPSAYFASPIHPDFGHGFYPSPGGIPFQRVPANQPTAQVSVGSSGQIDTAGVYAWPFPPWPNAAIETTSYGREGDDHHVLILQSSANDIAGPQTGACILYEMYNNVAVPRMYDAGTNTWFFTAGVHYVLNSNQIAANASSLDNGANDSAGIPILPLLVRYSEVPLGAKHPLRISFPAPTNWFVWPGTGCCSGSGPPQGLLYRLKASVNWQGACPVEVYPQAATVLQALQQYGAYMSDHGGTAYVGGAPDVRWDDNDLACMKKFHASDLEVVDNSPLAVSEISGQTKPYLVPATLPDGSSGAPYTASVGVVGGNPATLRWLISSGALPPGLSLNASAGTITGTPSSPAGSIYAFTVTVTDTGTGYNSQTLPFSIRVPGTGPLLPDLNIAKTHKGNFRQGQTGGTYSITVGNNGLLASSGPVTVTESLPAGLTLVSMAGTGWSCPAGGAMCTRSDSLAPAGAYPVITVTVNVADDAPAAVTNMATVSAEGETNTANNVAADLTTVTSSQFRITTTRVPVGTQYRSYGAAMEATGGTPPYTWSVVRSTGVSLPEGMSLDAATGLITADRVTGQGGYAVTVQVTDSGTPSPSYTTAVLSFGVNSDSSFGGCQMFPPDSIYNQRIDRLPADTTPSHQIPSGYGSSPIHPDFGHGFYPAPGGLPFTRVPANQPLANVSLAFGSQLNAQGRYQWPFPGWPNAAIEGTDFGLPGDDHHILILQSSVNNIDGPQTGPCTLYETYQSIGVPGMYDAAGNTWFTSAGASYVLNSNRIAASTDSLDNGGNDSAGIPMLPLLVRYSEIPLGARHPLRISFPAPTNWFVWPGTGCCSGSGPPQGLLYRLKAGVNWQAACPVDAYPQAATVLQALQQYGAYMSDHGGTGYVGGVPDVRWDDNDLACMKKFHVSDLEPVDNSPLEVSDLSGQTRPYVVPATLPDGSVGVAYSATLAASGGNPATRIWSLTTGTLPPGLLLDSANGTVGGTIGSSAGSSFHFAIAATDTTSGYISQVQAFSIAVAGPGSVGTVSITNSASGAGGAIAPGELVTIKGNGLGPAAGVSFSLDPVTGGVPTTLAGVQVWFGGWAAPILYASATQINAIVPWEVAGQAKVNVAVQSGSGSSGATVPVASAAPGVFTVDATGAGQAIATNPAAPGSMVTVYFTGGGVTGPPGVTGSVSGTAQRNLTQSVTASVGNMPATVLFAGAAPLLVDGVNQLNIRLSAATPSGASVPLTITVGDYASAATATLAVR